MSIRSNVIIINRVTVLVEHDIRTRFDELELDGARGTGGGYEVAGLSSFLSVGRETELDRIREQRTSRREGGREGSANRLERTEKRELRNKVGTGYPSLRPKIIETVPGKQYR